MSTNGSHVLAVTVCIVVELDKEDSSVEEGLYGIVVDEEVDVSCVKFGRAENITVKNSISKM